MEKPSAKHSHLAILHVTPQFAYFGGRTVVGGYAACVLEISAAQCASGHTVDIASRVASATPSCTDFGVRIHSLGSVERAGQMFATGRFLIRAVRFVHRRRSSIDVVHVHSGYVDYLLLSALVSVLCRRCAVVHTIYCPPSPGGWHRRLQGLLVRRRPRRMVLTAMSANVATELRRFDRGSTGVAVTRPPIDASYWSQAAPARPRSGVPPDRLVVLFVGNATTAKNMRGVIEATARARLLGLDMRLVVTTELARTSASSDVAGLTALAESCGMLPHITSRHIVEDIRSLYHESHVVMLPFLDTHGPSDYFVVALEAMAAGKVVVVSDLPGMREVVQSEESGYLVDPHSITAMAGALVKAANSDRAQIGYAARQRIVELFEPAAAMRALFDVYGRAMKGDARTQDFYDVDAERYDELRFHDPIGRADASRQMAMVREALSRSATGRALEVGPGTGRFSEAIADRSASLTLVDVSEEMLHRAHSRAGRSSARVNVVRASLRNLPFLESCFDCVVAVNVLTHVPWLDRALAELAEVTRSGGSVIVSIGNRRSLFLPAALIANRRGRAFGQDVASHWHDLARLRRAARDAGFEVVSVAGMYYTPRALRRVSLAASVLGWLDRRVATGETSGTSAPWLLVSMLRG